MLQNISFVLRDLSVKLGNFGCAREIDANSRNLLRLLVDIIRWMAPELIKKYSNFQGNYEDINVYTFNYEMLSFGILLWELCYETLPYVKWNIKQVANHVLSDKRERILNGNLNNPADKEIQLEFNKIIQEALFNKRATGFDRKFSDFDDAEEAASMKRGYEVAIKYSKRFYAELSILRKLDTSPYILNFYGHIQLIDNRDVIIFEWAEHRSLKEFYDSSISEHVLKGKRERLLLEKFNNPDNENIQKKLTEIIDKKLTTTYPILLDDQIYNLSETNEYSNLLNEQIIKENFVILWEELEDMEKLFKGTL
ncbi:15206_t:CDS:2, partial [Gigaspora margarita]